MTEASKSAPGGRTDNVDTNHYRRILKKEWNRGNPLAANFELTFRCNLKCEFCYNVDDPVSRELTTPQILDSLRKLKSLGVLYCALTGGEPMVHPDFWEIAQGVKRHGMALRLYTNGCYIDDRAAERFAGDVRALEVEISIHGATAETHDRLTGIRGSLDKALHGVRLLRRRGVKVILKTPITRTNENEVWDIQRLGRDLDAFVTFDPVVTPRDDGDMDPLRLQATPDFLRRFWSEEWKELRGGHEVTPMDHTEVRANCGTGRTTIALDPYGNIYPCIQWRRKAGNILEVEDLAELWRQSPVLQEVRDVALKVPQTTLKGCDSGEFCTFCMGVAEIQTGDPMGMYPQALTNARAKLESYNKKHEDKAGVASVGR
ncbi:MAG: radical SAM protein [Acidobacteria bacterium]|nr:radical SAM protein [Acidobacteriota bacterium]